MKWKIDAVPWQSRVSMFICRLSRYRYWMRTSRKYDKTPHFTVSDSRTAWSNRTLNSLTFWDETSNQIIHSLWKFPNGWPASFSDETITDFIFCSCTFHIVRCSVKYVLKLWYTDVNKILILSYEPTRYKSAFIFACLIDISRERKEIWLCI